MQMISPIDGYRLHQANDRLTAHDVVVVTGPRRGDVCWRLGEQGPQLPIGWQPPARR